MLRTHKMVSLGLSSLLVAGLTISANAATTPTQTQSAALQGTDVFANFTFNKFDSTLGTLTSITIDLSGTSVAGATVTGVNPAGTVRFTSSATLNLQDPTNTITLVQVIPAHNVFQHLGSAGDPALPYTFPTNSASADSGSVLFNTAPNLALFTGSGTIVLPFQGLGGSGTFGSGTITSTVSTQASGNTTLFYTYTPAVVTPSTPEPGTWAMMVAGASTGLVALRRRRNKK